MDPAFPDLPSDAAIDGKNLLTVPAQIGGKDEVLESAFDVVSPYTGKPVWKASDASPADAIRAVKAAEAALPAWSATLPKERQQILLKAADILFERREEIAALWRTETGTGVAMSSMVVPSTCDFVKGYANKATSIQGNIPTSGMQGQSALVYKVPIGVVLSVVPW